MKYFLTTLLVISALSLSAGAQEQTLFSNNVRVTGFGGPGVYYTQFNDDPHVLVGGSGAVLLNSTLYLGGGAWGLASRADAGMSMVDGALTDTDFEGGYCGLMVGAMLPSQQLVHAAVDVTVGGGSISKVRDPLGRHDWDEDDAGDELATDDFFMVQPMAHAEVNMFRWMRVDAGAGYRFVSGISEFGLDNSKVSGPVAGLSFRFGKF